VMISDFDWSDPAGHGGSSHGTIRIGHAFEDGRQPVAIQRWSLY